MQSPPPTKILLRLLLVLALQQPAAGINLRARGGCDVPSAYSVLSKASTGSAFCSSLLYPHGGSTSTVTVSATVTGSCKTVTATETEVLTKTVKVTESMVLPTTTIKEYTSTVLVPGGTHQPVDKRATSSATATATGTASTQPTPSASTGASASVSAAPAQQQQQCSPTPSSLCGCPTATLSTACSSLIPLPPPVTSTTTSTSTIKCPKDTTTITTTLKDSSTKTRTMTIYPPASVIYKTKTLTTTVPAACASPAYQGSGGTNIVYLPDYPYFPQTDVECCVQCYDAAFRNCVASAFIDSSGECQLLMRDNSTAGTNPSKQCPLGVENYGFGAVGGIIYPGPCGY